MASWQYRFYSTVPQSVFDLIGESWPSAMVRRHAWKVGRSKIFYVTTVLDDARAAEQFGAWLDGNTKRADISSLVVRRGGYQSVLFHKRPSLVKLLQARFAPIKRRYG